MPVKLAFQLREIKYSLELISITSMTHENQVDILVVRMLASDLARHSVS